MTPRPIAAILTLVLALQPVLASAPALLEGAVVAQAPIAGARVELADRAGTIVASVPVGETGTFLVESVPAGTYRVAVTTADGTYATAQPLTLAPGSSRNVQIAVKQQGTGGGSGSGDFWSSKWGKFTGVAIVVGGAALGAWLINDSGSSGGGTPTASASAPVEGN